jgi:hypothetical protein
VIRYRAIISWAAILCAVALSACLSRTETRPQEQNRAVGLDLKGGMPLTIVYLKDGSKLSIRDGTFDKDGKSISCAELKVMAPFLFQKLDERLTYYNADCRPAD